MVLEKSGLFVCLFGCLKTKKQKTDIYKCGTNTNICSNYPSYDDGGQNKKKFLSNTILDDSCRSIDDDDDYTNNPDDDDDELSVAVCLCVYELV